MIEVAEDNDRISSYYDIFMMITIIASLLPLTTKSQNAIWNYIDMITVVIFIADYLEHFGFSVFLRLSVIQKIFRLL